MPETGSYVGEKRKVRGYDSYWNGHGWQMDPIKGKESATVSAPVSDKPKVASKGTSGLEETQSKSLSQILAEREEKRKKAALIKSGGK